MSIWHQQELKIIKTREAPGHKQYWPCQNASVPPALREDPLEPTLPQQILKISTDILFDTPLTLRWTS